MPDLRVDQLTADASVTGTEELYVNDGGTDKKVTASQLAAYARSGIADGDIPASIARDAEVTSAISALSTVYQPLDSDLTAVAGLAPANDDIIQRKAGAWANRTIAQLLLDLAAPGTTFQPLDSDLSAIAALTTTAYGRALLALADAAALRTAAGLVIGTDVRAQGSGDPTRASLGLDTTDSPQFAGVNVGNATDTTITRTGAGDIAVEGNAVYRAGGTDVTVADGGTGASTKAAGFDALSPMTTSGDIIYGGASGTGTRLAKGTDGQVLTLASGVPAWAAGGGGSSGYDLDTYSIDATYGDDFTAASLDTSLWTRRNFTSGAETYQVGKNATYIRIETASRAAGDGYFQAVPAGDWTIAMKYIPRHNSASLRSSLGLCAIDSSGNGVAVQTYDSPSAVICIDLSAYTYAGTFTQIADFPANSVLFGERPVWLKLRKSGTDYFGAFSVDGEVWSKETPANNNTSTLDRIGMIAPLGFAAGANHHVDVDWFNKIA